MKTSSRQRAFTLVEFLVAFAIIGIVGMIVVPQYVSTTRHTSDKVAQERADLLDLAKNEYQDGIGKAAFYYWSNAADDEAKYRLLRPYLRKDSPAQLGRGSSANDYTLEGYTYILNELTNATTVVRNIDKATVSGPSGSSGSGGGASASSSGAPFSTSSGGDDAGSSSSGTTSSSSGGESSSGSASSSSSGGEDTSPKDTSSPQDEDDSTSSDEKDLANENANASSNAESNAEGLQKQREKESFAISPDADSSRHLKEGGSVGHSARHGASGEGTGSGLLPVKKEDPWFHPQAEQVVKESKPPFFDLAGDPKRKRGDKGFSFISIPYVGFLGPIIFAVLLLIGTILWLVKRRKKKEDDDSWRTRE